MLRSLRFRVPALFLAGILIAGLVSTAIAVSVSKSYDSNNLRKQAFHELGREAIGLTRLLAQRAGIRHLSGQDLELATGDQIFFVERAPGIDLFPGDEPAFTQLPRTAINFRSILRGKTLQLEFTPPGKREPYLAVARPLTLGPQTFGAILVGKPKARLSQGWGALIWRLLPAFLAGIAVAGALAWYLSRRITKPVLALADAADEVAAGRYDVALPKTASGDEIGQLAERFGEMAVRLHEADELTRSFLMTVSHELRTPLTAIRGHVEALREGVVSGEQARAASLDVIAMETERLGRLVGDILDLAKLEARRFTLLREEVDMERLVERAYAAFGEEARRRGIEYRRDVAARPVIVSDGDRVLQVISNLLSNAFRWTPDGGRVGVSLDSQDGIVSVVIDDSGPGIAPDERDRIFYPFWTRDDSGTGLGLAIARELALALGGSIELESEPGRGSRFELVLPTRPKH